MKRIVFSACLIALATPAIADYTVPIVSGTVKAGTVAGNILPTTNPVDANNVAITATMAAGPAPTSGIPILCQYVSGGLSLTTTQTGAAQCNTAGSLKVDGSAVTQPVSNAGTFATQAAQSGTWTVQPGNTANTTAWLVTGTGGTFPATQSGTWNITNISGTVSLPTGAATGVAQGSTTSGQVGTLMQGAVTTGAPTYTTAQTSPLSLDTAGNLRVNVMAGGGSGGTSSSFGAAYPATGTAAGAEYLTTPPTLTNGQMVALQTTSAGSLHVTADNTNANLTPGDAVSTSTYGGASPIIGATMLWNGTSYDRWKEGATTGVGSVQANVVSGGIASGAISSGAFASGSIASGAIASGAISANAAASGAFPAGSISDLAHGQGTMAASVPVVIASNQTNVPGNVAQINGVTPLMGNGVTGTGSQRVTIASDNTAFQIKATGNAGAAFDAATGAAPPANAILTGTVGGGATGGLVNGLIQADSSVAINVSTATTTQLVALSSGRKIYVTSFDVVAGGTGNITFEYGTGSNCGTGTTVLTGTYNLIAQSGIAKGNGLGPVLVVPAGNALCVLTSAAVQMSGSVSYAQF